MKRRLAAALVLLAAVPLALAARVPQNPFASKPAKEHALLQQLAGTWKASFKFLMPGMPGAGSGAGDRWSGAVNRPRRPARAGRA